ncbi:MAG: hypothetical protein BGO31_16975 [Bacteroidetes bacterium 43-16]|nr:MAG: hypothetical protein BGO31_16975 [Bacteroidetes bacterium 43-16]
MSNKKEQVEYLLQFVSENLSDNDEKIYKNSMEELSEKFHHLLINDAKVNPDSFTVDCLELFYDNQQGLPDELYKGFKIQDIEDKLIEMVRSLKTVLCKLVQSNPDKSFVQQGASDAWKDVVKFYFSNVALAGLGITNPVVGIVVSCYFVCALSSDIDYICQGAN